MYQEDDFIGYKGCIYQKCSVEPTYRRLECYLPSATGTYGEPIEDTFHRLCQRIQLGTLKPSFADGVRYAVVGDKMLPIKKEKV